MSGGRKHGAGPGAGIVLARPSMGAGVAHPFAGGDGFVVPTIAEAQLARTANRGKAIELDHNKLRALLDPLRRG